MPVHVVLVKSHKMLDITLLQAATLEFDEAGYIAKHADFSSREEMDRVSEKYTLTDSLWQKREEAQRPEAQEAQEEQQSLLSEQTEQTEQADSSLQRIDSEYARYLRHGEIYLRSIIAAVDFQQPMSLQASADAMPTAASTALEVTPSLQSNPLLAQRLHAISLARRHLETRSVTFEEDAGESVERLARSLRQSAGQRNVQLDTSFPIVVASEPKTISPRLPAKIKQKNGIPASVVYDNALSIVPEKPANVALQVNSPHRSPRPPNRPVPLSPSFAAGRGVSAVGASMLGNIVKTD